MISLRKHTKHDSLIIQKWPHYPLEFIELDYALRAGGWIETYQQKKDAVILIAEECNEIVGFSILSREGLKIAEFRIALHPEKLGCGLGKKIACLTLLFAFSQYNVETVRLDVRKNNLRAKKLYEALNFYITGEGIDQIQGNPVEMFRMEINKITFYSNKKKCNEKLNII